jgi:hypothetical protein
MEEGQAEKVEDYFVDELFREVPGNLNSKASCKNPESKRWYGLSPKWTFENKDREGQGHNPYYEGKPYRFYKFKN